MSVIVPRGTAEQLWGPPTGDRAQMLITTRLGAAAQIAGEAATALRPDHPEYLRAVPRPTPRTCAPVSAVTSASSSCSWPSVCLVIGAVGIANTTLVAVMERSGEIGLRRALGARARHITTQFLAESALLGLLGGVVGASVGVITIVAVSAYKHWTPILQPAALAAAPALGLATGLLMRPLPGLAGIQNSARRSATALSACPATDHIFAPGAT